ncbi:MAG: TetR/AcrR family transcriptional regulator [Actinomycetaceae bacterium]|nr:TetR/AcrR family transcriptional regulator [Actinomycetaceae bacterium]
MSQPPIGRRERNRQEKLARIKDAAVRLLSTTPYDDITTQELADEADVATGTFFRYINSKSDLLISVFSDRIQDGLDLAATLHAEGAKPIDSIMALVTPFGEFTKKMPANAVAYQRAVQFGPPDSPVRIEALRRVASFGRFIKGVLKDYCDKHPDSPRVDLNVAAHCIYATMNLDVVQVAVGHTEAEDQLVTTRHNVSYLLDVFLKGKSSHNTGI